MHYTPLRSKVSKPSPYFDNDHFYRSESTNAVTEDLARSVSPMRRVKFETEREVCPSTPPRAVRKAFVPQKEASLSPDEMTDYKGHLLEGIVRKVASGNYNSSSKEDRFYRDPFARKKPYFNPLKEKYTKFCVDLNTYQPDETDLNMSPEGKRRRRLVEDFEKSGMGVPGFAKIKEDYVKKIEDDRLWGKHRDNNRIKLFE